MKWFDIHTHRLSDVENHVVVFNAGLDGDFSSYRFCSVSLHPWYLEATKVAGQLEQIEKFATLPNVVAIGECGLDKVCSTDFELQKSTFKQLIAISERYGKPMILHCVKSFDEMIALRREFRPVQPWIIHGFRGKPAQAMQLLAQGFYFSFGLKFNTDTIKILPLHSILLETDNEDISIEVVYEKIAQLRAVDSEEFAAIVEKNVSKILNLKI